MKQHASANAYYRIDISLPNAWVEGLWEKITRNMTPEKDTIILNISTLVIFSFSIKNPPIKVMIGEKLEIVEKSPIAT